MQKILKIITATFLFCGFVACDTLEPKQYPLNPLNNKQLEELTVLLQRRTEDGKEKGIYKVSFDTINDHTLLNLMFSDKQTDLGDLEAYLLDQDLINKDYIPKIKLDSMVRAKELHDSLKLIEELEEQERNKPIEIIPVPVSNLIPDDSASTENSNEGNSGVQEIPSPSNLNSTTENTDSI